MIDGLKLLGQGLPIVFIVLAAIFLGIKLLHWLLPKESAPIINTAPDLPKQQTSTVSLSDDELQAINSAVCQATNGQGMVGKILDITNA